MDIVRKEVEQEIKKELQQMAEEKSAKVFADNLKSALMQTPIRNKIILGLDPGYAHGCKLAVIDTNGNPLETAVIYPHPPQNKLEQAKTVLTSLIIRHGVEVIAIGNGTACKESEILVADVIKENNFTTQYILVNEAGASVYSASKEAAEEFPGMDTNIISAISIARRLQDPMAELVKIDPRSLGLGQYQHDISKKVLETELKRVTETVVNTVGVDVNTASVQLLSHVSGLTRRSAQAIVDYIKANGKLKNRQELAKIKGLSANAIQQAAGFLKIYGGTEPLDEYFIHPEDYPIARQIMNLIQ